MRLKTLIIFLAFSLQARFQLVAQGGWTFKSSMPTPRSGICAAVLDGKIYVIGGQGSNGQILNVVERYDPEKDAWETGLPELDEERKNAAAVGFDGKIFVLGGRSEEDKVLKKVEFFDPLESEWESFDDLEKKREGLAAVVLTGTMYAVGGSDEKELLLDGVEYYDQATKKWKITNDWKLDFALASLVTVAVNDSAFSIGGFSILGPLGFVQRYHPSVGTALRTQLLTPRGGLAGTARGDTIYVIGGRGLGLQVLNSVEFFIPRLNKWQESVPLNTPRENFAAVTVNNKIYAIGGRGANGEVLDSVEEFALVTSVATKDPFVPDDFGLEQNYPNPFNAGTRIKFRISSQPGSVPIKLRIYNFKGQLIATLLEKNLPPGEHEITWHGVDQSGLPVASGIYIYTLEQGKNQLSKKMTLIR